MTWFAYAITPIDFGWELLPTVAEVASQLGKADGERLVNGSHENGYSLAAFLRDFEIARGKAQENRWAGDYRVGEGEPRVFWLPMETEFRYAFVWKQDNDGTTFIISPCALPWIEELT